MKHSVPYKKIVERMTAGDANDSFYHHHRAIRATASNLGNALESMEALAGTRSPFETPEKHAVRLAEAAKKLEGRINAAEENIRSTTTLASNVLNEAINRAAGLKEDNYAPEIRSAVRRLPARDRDNALLSAMKDGDAGVVAALTTGPALASGLTADFRDKMREQFRETQAANEYRAMNDLHTLMGDSATALGVARAAAKAAVDPDYISQIQQGQERAAKAQATFDGSLV